LKSNLQLSNHRRQWQRGAVTITALTPTAPVVPNLTNNTVVYTVSASAAGDTSASITHGFGLTNAEITAGYPFPEIIAQDGNQITSPWYEASEASNYTILQKGTTAAGGQVKVAVARPHTIVR